MKAVLLARIPANKVNALFLNQMCIFYAHALAGMPVKAYLLIVFHEILYSSCASKRACLGFDCDVFNAVFFPNPTYTTAQRNGRYSHSQRATAFRCGF